MAGSLQWDVKGWTDIDKYYAGLNRSNWEVRYQDNSLVVVRIPPSYSGREEWNVLRLIPGNPTRDWWLTVPRSRRPLKYALTEQFGADVARVVIEGIPPEDDNHAD